MMFPLVRDLAADGVPVRLTCGVLGFSAQAFYKWQNQPCSTRDLDDAYETNRIVNCTRMIPSSGIGSSPTSSK